MTMRNSLGYLRAALTALSEASHASLGSWHRIANPSTLCLEEGQHVFIITVINFHSARSFYREAILQTSDYPVCLFKKALKTVAWARKLHPSVSGYLRAVDRSSRKFIKFPS